MQRLTTTQRESSSQTQFNTPRPFNTTVQVFFENFLTGLKSQPSYSEWATKIHVRVCVCSTRKHFLETWRLPNMKQELACGADGVLPLTDYVSCFRCRWKSRINSQVTAHRKTNSKSPIVCYSMERTSFFEWCLWTFLICMRYWSTIGNVFTWCSHNNTIYVITRHFNKFISITINYFEWRQMKTALKASVSVGS